MTPQNKVKGDAEELSKEDVEKQFRIISEQLQSRIAAKVRSKQQNWLIWNSKFSGNGNNTSGPLD